MTAVLSAFQGEMLGKETQNSSDLMSPLEKDERKSRGGGRSVEVFPAKQVE